MHAGLGHGAQAVDEGLRFLGLGVGNEEEVVALHGAWYGLAALGQDPFAADCRHGVASGPRCAHSGARVDAAGSCMRAEPVKELAARTTKKLSAIGLWLAMRGKTSRKRLGPQKHGLDLTRILHWRRSTRAATESPSRHKHDGCGGVRCALPARKRGAARKASVDCANRLRAQQSSRRRTQVVCLPRVGPRNTRIHIGPAGDRAALLLQRGRIVAQQPEHAGESAVAAWTTAPGDVERLMCWTTGSFPAGALFRRDGTGYQTTRAESSWHGVHLRVVITALKQVLGPLR